MKRLWQWLRELFADLRDFRPARGPDGKTMCVCPICSEDRK